MSHDWPEGVVEYGDCALLLRSVSHHPPLPSNLQKWLTHSMNEKKPHFKEDIERHSLGCVQYMTLMNSLKPPYWLSGHMHCHFEAHIPHAGGNSTHFIALDKVLPRRHYLQVRLLQLPPSPPRGLCWLSFPNKVLNFPDKRGSRTLEYDSEWLAILRAVHKDFSLSPNQVPMPRYV